MQLDDTLENYVRRVADFHGCFRRAPGLMIGCHMVEWAMELLGEVEGKLNAVCETRVCLTDAVQVMTGCTVGNKYLHMRDDIGRYAFTLYARDTGEGVRVSLDVSKIDREEYPELYAFHTRTRDPIVLTDMKAREASGDRVMEEFKRIGRGCLTWERVKVNFPRKGPLYPSIVCDTCGEPFLRPPGEPDTCPVCRGESYYQVLEEGEG